MTGRRSSMIAVALGAVMLTLAGCSSESSAPVPATGSRTAATHVVAPGENLYRIALHYGVSVGRLMAANGISDPDTLCVGQVLVIPGHYTEASVGTERASNSHLYYGPRADRQFLWPVYTGAVSSGFGMRNGSMHEGVDIAAPAGTPIHAADRGVVEFAGQLHGYGNTVIIRHDDDYVTVYAHNLVNLVHEGDHVGAGQVIAEIGTSGHATGANLHFEVRRDNIARDPLAYLPPPVETNAAGIAAVGGM
jgi:murein DD-endopeptidase MepM/ murein hydrolase activator NlpD